MDSWKWFLTHWVGCNGYWNIYIESKKKNLDAKSSLYWWCFWSFTLDSRSYLVAIDHFSCRRINNSYSIFLIGRVQVLLQVNVGVDLLKDPVLEILQFEKYEEKSLSLEKPKNVVPANEDPCGDLLKWLLPLDNSISPPSRPLSPPPPSLSSSSSIRTTSSRPNSSASSTSQMFSFGNFRSYSMSALPPNNPPPPTVAPNPKPNFDTEDWNQFSYKSFGKPDNTGNEGLLSFRGVSLEPERFSVCCGLEGIYIPGNRWRRKIEIIQPLEIHSFAAECNTEDLLCVQIKVQKTVNFCFDTKVQP